MHRRIQWIGSRGILSGLCTLGLASCTAPAVDSKPSVYGAIALPPGGTAIGLTVTRPGPVFALQLPTTKQDASRSVATAGAQGMLRDPYAAFLFPLGYLIGGFTGGIFGVSESELKAAAQSISTVVEELQPDERIAQMIRSHLNSICPGRIRLLANNLPMEPAESHGRMRRDDTGRMAWDRPPPASHPLADTGTDIVVGLHVTFVGFQSRANPRIHSDGDVEKLNPPLALVLSVDVNAVRVRDWADVGGLTALYESPPRKFIKWAATDAQPLRREIEAGLQEIDRQIARQLTCGPRPSS